MNRRYTYSANPKYIIAAMQLLGSDNVWDRGPGFECVLTCNKQDALALFELTNIEPHEIGVNN
jgi:hypothetical protein